MARRERLEFPGAWYSVSVYGNGGRDIFSSDYDREKILTLFERAVISCGVCIHAYCLMDTEYHLLIETPQSNLSGAMRLINSNYSTYFNQTHKRSGHLFQSRFRAIIIDPDCYAKGIACYIHLAPVRARLCQIPEEYVWSSYPAYITPHNEKKFLTTEWLLQKFGTENESAVCEYKKFIDRLIHMNVNDPCIDAHKNLILGDEAFVLKVYSVFEALKVNARKNAACPGLYERLEIKVMRYDGGNADLRRKLFLYYARRFFSASIDDLNAYLGSPVTEDSIHETIVRIERERALRPSLNRKMQKIEDDLKQIA